MSTSSNLTNSNQQTLTESGANERPPMLEKGNYIPWEIRFRRFLDNKLEDGERMWNSIQNNGPYQRPMIVDLIHPILPMLKPLSKMTEGNKKQYIAVERIKRLMHGSKITTHVRHSRLMDEFDKFAEKEGEFFDSVHTKVDKPVKIMDRNNVSPIDRWANISCKNHDPLALIAHSNASSSHSHANSSYSPQPYYVTHPPSVVDYDDEYQGELQGDSQEDKLTTAMMLRLEQSLNGSLSPTNKSVFVFLNTRNQAVVQDWLELIPNQRHAAMKDEAGSNLRNEENDFMLDTSYGEDLEELTATIMLMARLQPADENAETVPSYDVKAVSQSIQTIHMLGKKPNKVYDPFLKDGLGYTNPVRLKKAIAAQPKMYDGDLIHNNKLVIHTTDSEETLKDAEEKLSAEQTYFSIPSTSDNGSTSKDVPSKSPGLKMPTESRLLTMIDTLGDTIVGFQTRINKTFLQDTERRWLSDSQNELREFYKTDVISMSISLYKTLCEIKEELIEEVQEMLNIFVSMEHKVNEKSPTEKILQNEIDRLLEASLTSEIRKCVLLSVEQQKHELLKVELEKSSSDSRDIQANLLKRIKILKNDFQRSQAQSIEFELKLQHQKEKMDCDVSWKAKLFNSIKATRAQHQNEMFEDVTQKTYAYADVHAQNQDLLMIISELKSKLKTIDKGKHAKNVSNTKVTSDRSNPVTSQSTPTIAKKQQHNVNVITRGMYKINQEDTKIPDSKANTNVSYSTGVGSSNSVRRPKSKDNKSKNNVLKNTKSSSTYVLKTTNSVFLDSNKCETKPSNVCQTNAFITNAKTVNVVNDGLNILCISCGLDVFLHSHEKCVARNALTRKSSVQRALFTSPIAAKSKGLEATSVVAKSRFSVAKTPTATNKVIQLVSWIVDSGCSKHMNGNLQLLRNFVEKFMGTVRFGNDHFAAITGYGDYVQGNLTICHVYYVKGIGHNLFLVRKFCDRDLEVAFRSNTCYVQNLEGDDLLTSSRDSNLYTISISKMAASSPVCLMSRVTSTKSWLWHRRLSHLNFGTINQLTSHDLVDGLLKFKYHKNHLSSACEHGKSKKASLPSKHRIQTRITSYGFVWANESRKYQWNLKAFILTIRTDNGTEFKNKKLRSFYTKLGIVHKTSIARTPQQNSVVERRNRTLVEVARTMLIFSKAQEFLWVEAIATACFTQNRSIIHTRHNKTPTMNCSNFNDSSEDSQSVPCTSDLDNLFGPMYEEYYPMSSQEVSDNSAANTLDNDHTSSSSSIVVDQDDAPPIVLSSEEQVVTEPNSPVLNEVADELVQEDVADFDGNMFHNAPQTPEFDVVESS
ncbi:retrovirus-related pol polyprotein from transposon TNT 1-94 [Tanacetum coccineum]